MRMPSQLSTLKAKLGKGLLDNWRNSLTSPSTDDGSMEEASSRTMNIPIPTN